MSSSQTLPPPEGPEYVPCGCGHIEPEHRPDAGPCLNCGCGAYRPGAPTAEDFLVAVEEALENNLLPRLGVAVLERTRDAVVGALVPLVAQLRAAAPAAVPSAPADRAARFREAADLVDAMSEGCSRARPCPSCNTRDDVSEELRRMAAETPQPETEPAEAHPAEHTWAAELYDPLAEEWVPGTRYLVRERAVNALDHAKRLGPTWKDGTPTQRRLVRATTTYTVETGPAVVAQPAKEA